MVRGQVAIQQSLPRAQANDGGQSLDLRALSRPVAKRGSGAVDSFAGFCPLFFLPFQVINIPRERNRRSDPISAPRDLISVEQARS